MHILELEPRFKPIMNSELIITAREGASMAGERTYSIGEVAELLGLAPSTIRFYVGKDGCVRISQVRS